MEGKKQVIGVKFFGFCAIGIGLIVSRGPVSEFLATHILNTYVVLVLSAAILLVIAGVGILNFKDWARMLLLWLLGLNMFMGLQGVYLGAPFSVVPGAEWVYLPTFLILSLFPFAVALIYFLRPEIRCQFRDQLRKKD